MAITGNDAVTGFGIRSTADEVLRGIDLSGRVAVVTGGYSGLGLETTRALVGAGARVVVPARRPAAARQALDGIEGVDGIKETERIEGAEHIKGVGGIEETEHIEGAEHIEGVGGIEVDALDLADLDSIRGFAARFLESGRDIDIMINNAGIMACPETRVGPGWEAQFAVNHLGHHALVNLLWPAIARGAGARVVVLTSAASPSSVIRWSDVHFRRGYDKWQAYAQAKRANALFAARLDVLGRQVGVRAFSVHPGYILTPLQRHLTREEMVAAGWVDAYGNLVDAEFKTVRQGAATQVWAATSPSLSGQGGLHCADCAIAEYEVDTEEAARLWALSAELTGIDAFDAGCSAIPEMPPAEITETFGTVAGSGG